MGPLGLIILMAGEAGGPVEMGIFREGAGALAEADASPEVVVECDGTAIDIIGTLGVSHTATGTNGGVSFTIDIKRKTGPGTWVSVGSASGNSSEYYDAETGNYVIENGEIFISIIDTPAVGPQTYKATASKTGAKTGLVSGTVVLTP